MRPVNALLLLLTTFASASEAVDIQERQTGGGHNCKCRGYPTPGIFCGNCVFVSNGSYLISEGRFDTHALVGWGGAENGALYRYECGPSGRCYDYGPSSSSRCGTLGAQCPRPISRPQ